MADNETLSPNQLRRQAAAEAKAKLNAAIRVVGSGEMSGEAVLELPRLSEFRLSGYKKKGVPQYVNLVSLYRGYLERATGYDYYLMTTAAALDDIALPLTVGFRSYAEQLGMYKSRFKPDGSKIPQPDMNWATGKQKTDDTGALLWKDPPPTVNPDVDTSNHQKGIAVDIDVGLELEDYVEDKGPLKVTPRYEWLVANAEKFGFDHVEGHDVGEAWHWVHKNDGKIYGLNYLQNIKLPDNLGITLASLAANPANTPGAAFYLGLVDEVQQAIDRAKYMRSRPRDKILLAAVRGALVANGRVEKRATGLRRVVKSAKPPIAFNKAPPGTQDY